MPPTFHPKPLTLVASVPVARHLAGILRLGDGHVESGMDATHDGTTLHLSAGAAIVNRTSPRAAYRVTFDASVDVSLSNGVNYVFLIYDASVVTQSSATPPADSIPLYVVTVVSGAVTTTVDARSHSVKLEVPFKAPGVDVMGEELTNIGAPMSPSSGARLQDVLDGAQVSGAKAPVRVATTAPITLSGLQTVDGAALSSGDRVLDKNNATASARGIYVAQSGAWVRATDFDSTMDAKAGVLIPVAEGTVNGGAVYGLDTPDPIVVGTTALAFSRRDVKAHEALQVAHGATAAPTPNAMMARDAAGRTQVVDGAAAADVATKGQMDAAVAAEGASRSAADSAEASTRAAADSAESAARTNGDATAEANAKAFAIQRANHTGTQLANTVSDFDAQVRLSRLDQMAAPTSDVSMGNHKITNGADPTASQDFATKRYVDVNLIIYDTVDISVNPVDGAIMAQGALMAQSTGDSGADHSGGAPGVFGPRANYSPNTLPLFVVLSPGSNHDNTQSNAPLPLAVARGTKMSVKGRLLARSSAPLASNPYELFACGVTFDTQLNNPTEWGHQTGTSRDNSAQVAAVVLASGQGISGYNNVANDGAAYTPSGFTANVVAGTSFEIIVSVPGAANSNDDATITVIIDGHIVHNAVHPQSTATTANMGAFPYMMINVDATVYDLVYKVQKVA